jgi:hypothetical protein
VAPVISFQPAITRLRPLVPRWAAIAVSLCPEAVSSPILAASTFDFVAKAGASARRAAALSDPFSHVYSP